LKTKNLQLPISLKFIAVTRTTDEQVNGREQVQTRKKKAKEDAVNICNQK